MVASVTNLSLGGQLCLGPGLYPTCKLPVSWKPTSVHMKIRKFWALWGPCLVSINKSDSGAYWMFCNNV